MIKWRKKMKKINRESPPEDLGPHKVEVEFISGKLFFKVNGKDFFMDSENASFLFGSETMMRLAASEKERTFTEFEIVENLALFQFLKSRGMNPREIASTLGFDQAEYLLWLSTRGGRITKLFVSFRREIEAKIAELEKERPLPEEKKEKEFWPDVAGKTGKAVVEMLLDGFNPRKIADKLGVPYDKFYRWYMDATILKYLTRKRNEEAEERRRKAEEDEERGREL
jgi:hypothetical protein